MQCLQPRKDPDNIKPEYEKKEILVSKGNVLDHDVIKCNGRKWPMGNMNSSRIFLNIGKGIVKY